MMLRRVTKVLALACLLAGAVVYAGSEPSHQELHAHGSSTAATAAARGLLQLRFVVPTTTTASSSSSSASSSSAASSSSSSSSASAESTTGSGGGLSNLHLVVLSVGSTLLAVGALAGGVYLCRTYCRHKESYLSQSVQAAQEAGLWPRAARITQEPSAAELTAAARRGGRAATAGAAAGAGDTATPDGESEAPGRVWMTAHVGGGGPSPLDGTAHDVEAAVGLPMTAFGGDGAAGTAATAVVIGVPVAVPVGPGMLLAAGGGSDHDDDGDGALVASAYQQQAAATLVIPASAAPTSPAAVAVARRAAAVSPTAAEQQRGGRSSSLETSGVAASAVSGTFSAWPSESSAFSSPRPSAPPQPQSPPSAACAVRPLPPSFYSPSQPHAAAASIAAIAGPQRRCLSAVPPLQLGPGRAPAAAAAAELLGAEGAGSEPWAPMPLSAAGPVRMGAPGTVRAMHATAAAVRYPDNIPEEGSSRRSSSSGCGEGDEEEEEARAYGDDEARAHDGHRSIGGSTVVIGTSAGTPSLNSTAATSIISRRL
ncbi:hypothetical protein HXX76_003687 [Chlamydomonas incerta]|uniref:Uncharacterized protein n=1 Tax=Chlamydomonas incerta TaxID=51695 RepID=A0A835W509_CHLIN|nr:hypothetical protein HXX76_003687 [Chlamydomonas incerta]|eukprot:KAG2440832.1 hypothetical protein HXX76_003687 [Chlamydomonas incerta]